VVRRTLKDFGSEQLFFKWFTQSVVLNYTILVAFFIYETFKRTVCTAAVKVHACAATLTRKLIDIAAALVQHASKIVLKVTAAT
jgi:hypothetical protein